MMAETDSQASCACDAAENDVATIGENRVE